MCQVLSAVKTELVDALKDEINAEKQLETENFGKDYVPTIPGFEITTNDAEVRLKKTHGNEKILVIFNVNHSVDINDEFHETENPQEVVPVALPPLTIEITKGDERLCFHLELVEPGVDNGEFDFRVEEFYIAPVSSDEEVPASVYASSGRYIDPHLHDLLFVRFLEERGFNTQFCQQLVKFATHYEHSRYVSLLDKIKNFVGK
ncbi:unnamed protein product [Dracunculus medinensis]|uniref:Uncharacterized protein n=1 Tax=Dracunculus medinensis TaxID=318479 RepID=A0A3P7PRM4_DRAME|nr:unnamed protein product [Dracunculus medinensis]